MSKLDLNDRGGSLDALFAKLRQTVFPRGLSVNDLPKACLVFSKTLKGRPEKVALCTA